MEDMANTQGTLSRKDVFRRILLHIPFVLLVLASILFLSGGALLVFYSFVFVAATASAMMFMITFGGGILAIGAGLGSIEGFKLYLAYYNEQEKFIRRAPKETKKKLFSYGNICLMVMLVGSVCVLISAVLGSLEPKNWLDERSNYMAKNGYFVESQKFETSFNPESRPLTSIEIAFENKNAVVIYTDDSLVTVSGYCKYDNQIAAPAYSESTKSLTLRDTPSPRGDGATEKLLFFLFDDTKVQAQVRVYIPLSMKDSITIIGNYVVAQN